MQTRVLEPKNSGLHILIIINLLNLQISKHLSSNLLSLLDQYFISSLLGAPLFLFLDARPLLFLTVVLEKKRTGSMAARKLLADIHFLVAKTH